MHEDPFLRIDRILDRGEAETPQIDRGLHVLEQRAPNAPGEQQDDDEQHEKYAGNDFGDCERRSGNRREAE